MKPGHSFWCIDPLEGDVLVAEHGIDLPVQLDPEGVETPGASIGPVKGDLPIEGENPSRPRESRFLFDFALDRLGKGFVGRFGVARGALEGIRGTDTPRRTPEPGTG